MSSTGDSSTAHHSSDETAVRPAEVAAVILPKLPLSALAFVAATAALHAIWIEPGPWV